MSDEHLILCAAACGLAAYLGWRLGQQQQAATQQAQPQPFAPIDNTAWLMAGGWRA